VSARLLDPPPDELDRSARATFADDYGRPDLGPLVVVIAAYRESESIGRVVAATPADVLGVATAVLVVDDGSDDATADVARDRGAYVCRTAQNRGQGAALRLGYQIAIDHGAAYVATLDADGQYDPDQLGDLLEPILAGTADFVSGSRRLGRSYRGDRLRGAGVVAYAGLIRVLTGAPISDPSFGMRVMRAEVAADVPLRQPQYQAAELLVGAIARGYRVAERPADMRARSSGASRKGADVLYGYRFGTVVLSTWWRERHRFRHGRRIA
jgi:glycosyltransferase involved in cell wall biosynthesis